MTMVTNLALQFDIDDEEIKKREKIDDEHYKRAQEAFDTVVGEIKNAKDWKIVTFGDLQKRNIAKNAVDRGPIMQGLQMHENIISRPSQKSQNADIEIGSTIPLEYKYVSAEEKEEAGYDGICFKKVQGPVKEAIVNSLWGIKLNGITRAEIFSVAEQLIILGANDNKGWVKLLPLYIAAKSNVVIKNVLKAIDILQKAHVLVVSRIHRANRNIMVCCMSMNRTEYERYEKEAKTPEKISIYTPEKKTRNRSGNKASTKPETDTALSDQEILNYVDELLAEEEERTKTAKKLEKTEKRPAGSVKMGTLREALEDFSLSIVEKMEHICAETDEKISEQRNLLAKASNENTELRREIDKLKAMLEKKKQEEKALLQFHNQYVGNVQDVLDAMGGDLNALTRDFVQKKIDTDKFKRESSRIIREANTEIMDYKPDKYPPALKN